MTTIHDFLQRMRMELSDARDAIDRFSGHAHVKGSLAKLEAKEALEKLARAALDLESHLDRLDQDSGRAFDDIKAGAEKAWQDLRAAVHAARKEFD